MKHLSDEERLALIEGRATKISADHMAECAACAAEVASMRRAIQRLENFEWPAPVSRRVAPAPVLKWALAAGIALFAGIGIGRLSGPISAEIQASVKEQVAREVRAQLAANAPSRPDPKLDPTAILTLLTELREQQAANYLSLRKDLETLAENADARLQSTRRQIMALTTTAQPTKETIQ